MSWLVPLAHGALGPYDEIIIPLLAIGFVAAILVTWFLSRNSAGGRPAETTDREQSRSPADHNDDNDSHFRLD